GPGEHFGEIALLDEAPRSASVMTLEPSSFLIISKGDFKDCLAKNPNIAIPNKTPNTKGITYAKIERVCESLCTCWVPIINNIIS
ncbi:MAG: cyclic nucleotide-binding domain-containing protein, partial [Bacteroidetes bacterium]|nr:cyclic nucleotide-binding domain-containing protein [Bacteroidota bacterium]